MMPRQLLQAQIRGPRGMGCKQKHAAEVGFLQQINRQWRACAKGKEGRAYMPLRDTQKEALADLSKAKEGAADTTDVAHKLAVVCKLAARQGKTRSKFAKVRLLTVTQFTQVQRCRSQQPVQFSQTQKRCTAPASQSLAAGPPPAGACTAQMLAMKRKNKLLMQGYAYFCVDQRCSGYLYQSIPGQGNRKLPSTKQYVYTQARLLENKSQAAQRPSPSPQKKKHTAAATKATTEKPNKQVWKPSLVYCSNLECPTLLKKRKSCTSSTKSSSMYSMRHCAESMLVSS